MRVILDKDTKKQCDAFDSWTQKTAEFYKRQQHPSGAVGYDDIEWDAFQEGWYAAKNILTYNEHNK